jgi:competence protein ComER
MKVGFIGTGSMGSLLIEAFVRSGALQPANIVAATRTASRAQPLAERFPGLRIAASGAAVAEEADWVIVCVKPADYRAVLDEIGPVLKPGQIVVSITSPVLLEQLERLLPCKVAKMVPSVVNAAGAGAVLAMYGTRLTEDDRRELGRLFSAIGRPVEIDERDVRVASDLSSCGPAFIAYLLESFVDAAVETAGIDRELASSLACDMLLGTARLLKEGTFSPRELQAKVSVPGGITAIALDILRRTTADAFPQVLRATHRKFAEDLAKMEDALAEK